MTNSIIQRAKNEALDFFNSFNVDKAFLGDKEITLNEMLTWWKDELTRVTGASNILYYQAMIEATELLINDQPKTLQEKVAIIKKNIVKAGYTPKTMQPYYERIVALDNNGNAVYMINAITYEKTIY